MKNPLLEAPEILRIQLMFYMKAQWQWPTSTVDISIRSYLNAWAKHLVAWP